MTVEFTINPVQLVEKLQSCFIILTIFSDCRVLLHRNLVLFWINNHIGINWIVLNWILMFKRGYLIFFCLLFIKLINILNYFVLERNLYSICSKLIGGELLVSLYKSQVYNILFDCHLFDFDLSFIFNFLKKLSLNTTNLFFIIIEFNILTFKLIIIVIVCKNLFITCI